MVFQGPETTTDQDVCVIVGASHAGVNCAFELRKQGFEGRVLLIDADPHLPYHRPPLSKAFLNTPLNDAPPPLKAQAAYERAGIELVLGVKVNDISANDNTISVAAADSSTVHDALPAAITYTHLVLATGARPIVPPIPGLSTATHCLVMRNASDAYALKSLLEEKQPVLPDFHVVVVGAGYIGLEAAASLRKAGAKVTVIEREKRILARVASEAVSTHVASRHEEQGVTILCERNVQAVQQDADTGVQTVVCDNDIAYRADAILVGVGVRINGELAAQAELEMNKGAVCVDAHMQTSRPGIWAIGDCTSFPQREYGENTHIESVQNALEQAKVAAKNIHLLSAAAQSNLLPALVDYAATPWFWSDQFDMKLQMVGLVGLADNQVVRVESDRALSVWHFNGDKLISVEAINSPKAYVLGGRAINNNTPVDKAKLQDGEINLATLF
ncbi:NAD(P)/FAD-dependent oxidoreductase [Aestuariibacter sp. A3R04]|uniref:NAD(P)/FAD-dependent oxidoreductase n=1 Tax=Aestuariibacter sp. A3R04 TaxID=2841571 RepID=UPI001C082BC7|nr:FAD-dependent oxidoreductase [Aestuariibacter sp. A3R04]MBU3021310.1 FAD-dependent oxidoreductase [Aestuariibacter sp. A3R04]